MRTITIVTSAMLGVAVVVTPTLAAQPAQPAPAKAAGPIAKKPTDLATHREEEVRRVDNRRHAAREAEDRCADRDNKAEERDDD